MTNEEMERALEKGEMTTELAIKLLSETGLDCMYEEATYEALDMAIEALKRELKIEKMQVLDMRGATEEERKSLRSHIDKISKPTGFNFWKEVT